MRLVAFWQDYSNVVNSSSIASTVYNNYFSSLKRSESGKIIQFKNSNVVNNTNDACYDKHVVHETNKTHRGKKQWELEWNMRYEELKEYIAEHSNALVPHIYTQNQSLGYWVHTQRKYFKSSQTGNAIMHAERIQKLNEIGFVWDASKFHSEAQWLEKMQELKDYKLNFGNTLVPAIYDTNPSLGIWVSHQRQCYTYYQKMMELEEKWRDVETLDDEVKKEIKRLDRLACGMNNKRIEILEAEGFIWDLHEVQWLEMLDELRVYKEINGDTLVPKLYPVNPSLGSWVSNQRRNYTHYKKMKEMEEKWRGVEVLDDEAKVELERLNRLAFGMTEERIQLLEVEGFIWDVHSHAWELQFQELRSFIDVNGHAPVMSKKTYNPLASWVNTQRKSYIKSLKGQYTTLTEERIKRLDSIGFDWKLAQRSSKFLRRL